MNTTSLLVVTVLVAVTVAVSPAYGQVTTSSSCTSAMISSVTPCMNFLTSNSSSGTLAPSSDCCTSLKNLTNGGMGCVCLLVTGSVPVQIPINRTLSISLPRACNMPGVPVQCNSAAATAPSPVPVPGPSEFVPVASPPSAPASTGSSVPPESDTKPSVTVPSSPPTSTVSSHSNVTPSSDAKASRAFSPAFALLVALASALFYCH